MDVLLYECQNVRKTHRGAIMGKRTYSDVHGQRIVCCCFRFCCCCCFRFCCCCWDVIGYRYWYKAHKKLCCTTEVIAYTEYIDVFYGWCRGRGRIQSPWEGHRVLERRWSTKRTRGRDGLYILQLYMESEATCVHPSYPLWHFSDNWQVKTSVTAFRVSFAR